MLKRRATFDEALRDMKNTRNMKVEIPNRLGITLNKSFELSQIGKENNEKFFDNLHKRYITRQQQQYLINEYATKRLIPMNTIKKYLKPQMPLTNLDKKKNTISDGIQTDGVDIEIGEDLPFRGTARTPGVDVSLYETPKEGKPEDGGGDDDEPMDDEPMDDQPEGKADGEEPEGEEIIESLVQSMQDIEEEIEEDTKPSKTKEIKKDYEPKQNIKVKAKKLYTIFNKYGTLLEFKPASKIIGKETHFRTDSRYLEEVERLRKAFNMNESQVETLKRSAHLPVFRQPEQSPQRQMNLMQQFEGAVSSSSAGPVETGALMRLQPPKRPSPETPTGKTILEQYNEAVEELKRRRQDYNEGNPEDVEMMNQLLLSIEDAEQEMNRLSELLSPSSTTTISPKSPPRPPRLPPAPPPPISDMPPPAPAYLLSPIPIQDESRLSPDSLRADLSAVISPPKSSPASSTLQASLQQSEQRRQKAEEEAAKKREEEQKKKEEKQRRQREQTDKQAGQSLSRSGANPKGENPMYS